MESLYDRFISSCSFEIKKSDAEINEIEKDYIFILISENQSIAFPFLVIQHSGKALKTPFSDL